MTSDTPVDQPDGMTRQELVQYVRLHHPEPEQLRVSTESLTDAHVERLRQVFAGGSRFPDLEPAERAVLHSLANQLGYLAVARDTTFRHLARSSGLPEPMDFDAAARALLDDDVEDGDGDAT